MKSDLSQRPHFESLGLSPEAFTQLDQTLRTLHQKHYQLAPAKSLHQDLEEFRHPKGMDWVQKRLAQPFLNQRLSGKEEAYQRIDDSKGDRTRLNQVVLKTLESHVPEVYSSLILPDLVPDKKHGVAFALPPQTDAVLFATEPMLVFALIAEMFQHLDSTGDQTRTAYIANVIDRWWFKFCQLCLNHEAYSPEVWSRRVLGSGEHNPNLHIMENCVLLLVQRVVSEPDHPITPMMKHQCLRMMLILLKLIEELLANKAKVPDSIQTAQGHLLRIDIYERHHFLKAGLRSEYENWHPFPDSPQAKADDKLDAEKRKLLASMQKKRFLRFYQRLRSFSREDQLRWLMHFAKADQVRVAEAMVRSGASGMLAQLHQSLEMCLNNKEYFDLSHEAQRQGKGSQLLGSFWKVARRFNLGAGKQFSKDPKVIQWCHQVFGEGTQLPEKLAQEYDVSWEDHLNQKASDWRKLALKDMPTYTRAKSWEKMIQARFSIPQTNQILFYFMPYTKLSQERLADRLPVYHCLEFCRLTFRYLTPALEQKYTFHFLTIGELLLMQIVRRQQKSAFVFFRHALETGQLDRKDFLKLLVHVYPVLETNFGEMIRANVRFINTQYYSYRTGGLHGQNVATALDRLEENEDYLQSYLAAGKVFCLVAMRVMFLSLEAVAPGFRQSDQNVPKSKLLEMLESKPLTEWIRLAIKPEAKKFLLFWKWWTEMKADHREIWQGHLLTEILFQHGMYFDPEYPNRYLMPTQ